MYKNPADRNPADDMHKTRVSKAAVMKLRRESGPSAGKDANIFAFRSLASECENLNLKVKAL